MPGLDVEVEGEGVVEGLGLDVLRGGRVRRQRQRQREMSWWRFWEGVGFGRPPGTKGALRLMIYIMIYIYIYIS